MDPVNFEVAKPGEIQKLVENGRVLALAIKPAKLCFDLLDMQYLQAMAMLNLQKLNRIPTEEEVRKEMEPCVEKEQYLAETYSFQNIAEVRAAIMTFIEFYEGRLAPNARAN